MALALTMTAFAQEAEHQHFRPVNPNATPEAQQLLARLYQVQDSGQIISGLHHNQLWMPNYAKDLNRIKETAGRIPLIWGGDLAWDAGTVIEMAAEQYEAGHIITLMWHSSRPYDRGPVDFETQTKGQLTPQEWEDLVTEGTRMNRMWMVQVDSIAMYLKVLQQRNIPVLWRPYHEMNGEWFWWGNHPGTDGFARLWQMLYDRLTNHHHLDNLIWVWNANAMRDGQEGITMWLDNYYPGPDYVDVLATDVYHNDWRKCHHNDLNKLANGKLIALGEVGELPSPKVLATMPKFAWFMLWTGYAAEQYNSAARLEEVFQLPNVVNYQRPPRQRKR